MLGALMKKELILFLLATSLTFAIDVSACQNITVAGSYIQINNLTVNGTCINIWANNVVYDCAGYLINGSNAANDALPIC